tara:strand:+ start:11006 stop:11374 length:369 start_codon:yes stop_codon:yes gene_type:complete
LGVKQEKKRQLGMDPGTASNRLKKDLLFEFTKRLGMHWCFQCGAEIESCDDFTVEHKTPWLHSEDPKGLFFDIDNIAFSHKSCNYRAARAGTAKPCPSTTAYRNGCRCEGCKDAQNKARKKE